MKRDEINEMIDFFIKTKQKIHIELSSGKYYNGFAIEFETGDVIIFKDRILGVMRIFLNQIEVLEEFRE